MGMKDKKKTNRNKKLANQTDLKLGEKDKRVRSAEVKKRKRVKESNGNFGKVVQVFVEDNSPNGAKNKKKAKVSRKKKVRNVKNNDVLEGKHDQPTSETDDVLGEINDDDEMANLSMFEMQGEIGSSEVHIEDGKTKKDKKNRKKDRTSKVGVKSLKKGVEAGQEDESRSKGISSIFKKALSKKKRDLDSSKPKKTLDREEGSDLDDVYLIPSGDEDSSKGMKKWVVEYHESRPGLKVLQQRIDDFISAHEAKLEQERKDKEARAAEGGWTVVKHHKGRKKTTDAESGITVGSSSQAAVEDMVAKKKQSGVGLDFYRFQRKEAQRNEIMMLQSKFEQDKKRIQQLRAARKFKPY